MIEKLEHMREYQGDEANIATRLQEKAHLGQSNLADKVEWVGPVDFASHKELDFQTNNWSDGVELGPIADKHIEDGGQLIVHHNHIGLQSLSGGDWFGMTENLAIKESWVHGWDGSRFWGRIKEEHLPQVREYCWKKTPDTMSIWSEKVEVVPLRWTGWRRS